MTAPDRTATAIVPGHVTTCFSVRRRDDPARTGSRGAGLALADGVGVTVSVDPVARATDDPHAERPEATATVTLPDATVTVPAVKRVLDRLSVTATVQAETDLPLGRGFGVSGALALGTALAANAAAGLGRSENELITAAHVAEVRAGTGLGDVVGQAHGGVPIRLAAGAPGHGRLDGVPARPRVEYVTLGALSTETVLAGDTDRLSAAGDRAVARLRERPTLATLFDGGREFARAADLLTDRVSAVLEDVRAAGGEAAMAMLGETVIALEDGLSAAGYDARSTTVAGGAALESPLDR